MSIVCPRVCPKVYSIVGFHTKKILRCWAHKSHHRRKVMHTLLIGRFFGLFGQFLAKKNGRYMLLGTQNYKTLGKVSQNIKTCEFDITKTWLFVHWFFKTIFFFFFSFSKIFITAAHRHHFPHHYLHWLHLSWIFREINFTKFF